VRTLVSSSVLLTLLSCAAVVGPSFRLTEVQTVTAYTRSEIIFVRRVGDAGILVAGNFGSPSLPDRAFVELLALDGGLAGPAPTLIHDEDPFRGTHAYGAAALEDTLGLAGSLDSPDSVTTGPAAWLEPLNIGRGRGPGWRSAIVWNDVPSARRLNGSVWVWVQPVERDMAALCSVGHFATDAGSGAFFAYETLTRFSGAIALNVSANALARVENRCVAVGRADGVAVSLDLTTLPLTQQGRVPSTIDRTTLVHLGQAGPGEALGISSQGDIVGWQGEATSMEVPAIRVKGKDAFLRTLPLPPAWRSGRALASTRSLDGRVFAVGSGIDEQGNKRALMWTDRDVFPLDSRVPGHQSDWKLEEATAVDAQLDIVGNGRHGDRVRAFLLVMGSPQ
jgi:hypothetical protein